MFHAISMIFPEASSSSELIDRSEILSVRASMKTELGLNMELIRVSAETSSSNSLNNDSSSAGSISSDDDILCSLPRVSSPCMKLLRGVRVLTRSSASGDVLPAILGAGDAAVVTGVVGMPEVELSIWFCRVVLCCR